MAVPFRHFPGRESLPSGDAKSSCDAGDKRKNTVDWEACHIGRIFDGAMDLLALRCGGGSLVDSTA